MLFSSDGLGLFSDEIECRIPVRAPKNALDIGLDPKLTTRGSR